MKFFVGLGNPGPKYAHTRHNAGFLVIDWLCEQWQSDARFEYRGVKKDARYERHDFVWSGGGKSEKVALIKPLTFMNRSGEVVRDLVKFAGNDFDIRDDLWVLHDELDLILGRIKLDRGSSSAGHNGVGNIIDHLGTKDFPRIRIGIKSLDDLTINIEDFVLDAFGKDEQATLSALWPRIGEVLLLALSQGFEVAQNECNKKAS